jgi:hypothetical protein
VLERNELVNAVKHVTDTMAEISAASAEQNTGIEQVNQAIAQMDEVTQQNAALVKEAAQPNPYRKKHRACLQTCPAAAKKPATGVVQQRQIKRVLQCSCSI